MTVTVRLNIKPVSESEGRQKVMQLHRAETTSYQ